MIEKATNPGLQAALSAYGQLRLLCNEIAVMLHPGMDSDQVVKMRLRIRNRLRSAAREVDKYTDWAMNAAMERLLKDLDSLDQIEEFVQRMDIDDVTAYARANDIDHDDISTWLDDMWPQLESELRVKVADHLSEQKGE